MQQRLWSPILAKTAALALASVTALNASACLTATPFGVDPEPRDLTEKNLEALSARPSPEGAFRFVALGDTHNDYENFARAVDIINERDDIEFVLHAGDLSDLGLQSELEWAADTLSRLDVPFLTVIGNHDAISRGIEIYRTIFGAFDYTFTWGGIKFVLLNSNTLEFGAAVPDRTFLTTELFDRGDASLLVLFTHHPLTNPDDLPNGTNREFYDGILKEGYVDLLLHGHVADWSFQKAHNTPVMALGTFQNVPYFTIFTVDPKKGSIQYQRCKLDECVEVPAPTSVK